MSKEYVFDMHLPLQLSLPKGETSEPICLQEIMVRLTLSKAGRLRGSVGGAIILDTFSERSGELLMHRRTKKIMDRICGPLDLGKGLRIESKPATETETEGEV